MAKNIKFYRIDNFKNQQVFLAPSSATISDVFAMINKSKLYKNYELFYCFHMIEQSSLKMSLEEFISLQKQKNKLKKLTTNSGNDDLSETFFICEMVEPEDSQSQDDCEQISKIKHLMMVAHKQSQQEIKPHWTGANGHVIFQGRKLSILASSLGDQLNKPENKRLLKKYESSLSKNQNSKEQQIMQLHKTVTALKQENSLNMSASKIREHRLVHSQSSPQLDYKANLKQKPQINKIYSNFDYKFITSLEKTYLSYMIRSGFKLHYNQYKQWGFSVVGKRFTLNQKIGIIGDYGTGLPDSYELLENMVVRHQVDIIVHLGDVYYAGTPEQYENNVTKFIKTLRLKIKRPLYFYSIPGNHDYYSWGLPFLCFVKGINEQQFAKQEASYFCLRSEDDSWQILGVDTAFHDSNPMDQLNSVSEGPRIRRKQLQWHKEKLQNFKGSTILLSHHQLFSIHDRLCGSLSKYKQFSCLNPILSNQLFQYSPYISAWYWGHEHAFMLFRDDYLGLPKCRLLGNSSFHVVCEEEHPYERKKGFPLIPFIESDQSYELKYLPYHPKKIGATYFNLCYGVLEFDSKNKQHSNAFITYYCSPSYSDNQKISFPAYKIYEEEISSKQNIIQNTFKDIFIKKSIVYLKCEIGLVLGFKEQKSLTLTLHHKDCARLMIRKYASKDQQKSTYKQEKEEVKYPQFQQNEKSQRQEKLRDLDLISFNICLLEKELCFLLNTDGSSLELTSKLSSECLWVIHKQFVMHDVDEEVKQRNSFTLESAQYPKKYLTWDISTLGHNLVLKLGNYATSWMFIGEECIP